MSKEAGTLIMECTANHVTTKVFHEAGGRFVVYIYFHQKDEPEDAQQYIGRMAALYRAVSWCDDYGN